MLMMTMTMMCGMTLLLHLIQALALDSLPLNSSPPLPILIFANYSSSSLSRGILFLRFLYMGTQQYD